jgi:hypothetical protein
MIARSPCETSKRYAIATSTENSRSSFCHLRGGLLCCTI